MARIQILELPTEHHGDDMITPWVLVIDRCEGVPLEMVAVVESHWRQVGEQIGAKGTLIFMESVDIPANEVPVDPDGYPLKIRVEGDFEQFHAQAEQEIREAQSNLAAALGSDQATQYAAEVEQLRAGEESYINEGIAPTPGQWIWKWNRATPEKRLNMAAQILDGMPRANDCFMADHEAMIEALRVEVQQLRSAKPDA